jgi:dynein heavy chain, axonemal
LTGLVSAEADVEER